MRVFCVSVLVAMGVLFQTACQSVEHSYITGVADVPLKNLSTPPTSWESSPLRANTLYLLHGAKSDAEAQERVGDYYYVRWYDAEPDKPVRLVMSYTQSRMGSTVLTAQHEMKEPRSSAGTRMYRFAFNGPVRDRLGDVLSWRVELYVDGQLRDSRQSYLWQDPSVTGAEVVSSGMVAEVVTEAMRKLPEAPKAEPEKKAP